MSALPDKSPAGHRLLLELTEEQRRHIFEQTGRDARLLGLPTNEATLRCTFAGLQLELALGVFPPQRRSEELVAAALASVADVKRPVLIDVGTGCGAIAFALAAARPAALVYGTDVSKLALRCARDNRRRLALKNVRFKAGSILDSMPATLRRRVHAITSNLPYVPPDYDGADWFPPGTVTGQGSDGLGLQRQLATAARTLLRPNGVLLFQLLASQWAVFADELALMGYAPARPAPSSSPDRIHIGMAAC